MPFRAALHETDVGRAHTISISTTVYSSTGEKANRAPVRNTLPATAEKARTWAMFDTTAVFHAPMFALNASARLNACEPNPRGPRFCMYVRVWMYACMYIRTYVCVYD